MLLGESSFMANVTRSIFAIARCNMATGQVLDVWSAAAAGFVNPLEQPVSTYGETEISEALRMASRLQATDGNQGLLLQVIRGQESINYDLADSIPKDLPIKGRSEVVTVPEESQKVTVDVTAQPA